MMHELLILSMITGLQDRQDLCSRANIIYSNWLVSSFFVLPFGLCDFYKNPAYSNTIIFLGIQRERMVKKVIHHDFT